MGQEPAEVDGEDRVGNVVEGEVAPWALGETGEGAIIDGVVLGEAVLEEERGEWDAEVEEHEGGVKKYFVPRVV